MLKTFLFVAIATAVQCLEVRDKLKDDPVIKYQPPAQQGQRLDGFRPRSEWSYYFPSWSQYFKDDDEVEESPNLLKRLAAVEQMIKELNALHKLDSTGNKKPESEMSTSCKKDPPPEEPVDKVPEKNEKKPEIKDKPAKPGKNTEASETVNKPKKPAEKPKPAEAAEPTHDKDSSEDSPSEGHDKETIPPNVEEETLRE